MKLLRRQLIAAAAASLVTPFSATRVFASPAYPTRPVRVVIPFPAGGPTDVVGRMICQRLADVLRQPFVIDNRGGASGTIGADAVAKALPDGHTLLINVSAHVINPSLYSKLPHDPLKDFAPVTSLASTPIQLVVGADLPVRSIKELVSYIKSKPGACSFASSSNGTPGHLAGEVFKMATGVDALHVPYKGSAPALTDVIGGQVTYMFDSMPSSLAFVKAGRLRSLGVTGTQRAKNLPDVPTLVESGFPEMTMTTWYGMWAPARTPIDIVARIQEEVANVLSHSEVKARLADLSADGMGEPPERFAAYCRSESERYASIIKAAGIRLQ
jgi:tripartite-type tricarboxylate transporter receptor subunit TctC